jgi:plasmid stabilization system protein ParE
MAIWRLTGKAKRGLADIRRFTMERCGEEKAENYLKNIYGKIRLAAAHPEIGIDRSESLNMGLKIRGIVCASHVIYYTVSEDQVTIVAVLHHGMIPRTHLPPRLGFG